MSLPSFTADSSLRPTRGRYRNGQRPAAPPAAAVIPAIPNCANCDFILDRCVQNNWRPRAVCNACASGNCFDEPPMPDPFPDPFTPLPRF